MARDAGVSPPMMALMYFVSDIFMAVTHEPFFWLLGWLASVVPAVGKVRDFFARASSQSGLRDRRRARPARPDPLQLHRRSGFRTGCRCSRRPRLRHGLGVRHRRRHDLLWRADGGHALAERDVRRRARHGRRGAALGLGAFDVDPAPPAASEIRAGSRARPRRHRRRHRLHERSTDLEAGAAQKGWPDSPLALTGPRGAPYVARSKEMSSSMTVPGPTGSRSGDSRSSLTNESRSAQAFRSSSLMNSTVSSSPAQRR